MTREELKERYRQFSLRIIKMVDAMPNTISANAIAKQIIRSGLRPLLIIGQLVWQSPIKIL